MLYKTWALSVNHKHKPLYQYAVDCTYFSVIGSFNNWNIFQLKNKNRLSDICKVFLGGISKNMESLVNISKYGAINIADPTKMGYYVVNYTFRRLYITVKYN